MLLPFGCFHISYYISAAMFFSLLLVSTVGINYACKKLIKRFGYKAKVTMIAVGAASMIAVAVMSSI